MLNVYAIEKRLKDYETRSQRTTKEESWKSWKDKHYEEWLQNYRRRVEKFVVDVDENGENYEYLFAKHKNKLQDPLGNKACIGLPHFIFRPYKSEKERVKVRLIS